MFELFRPWTSQMYVMKKLFTYVCRSNSSLPLPRTPYTERFSSSSHRDGWCYVFLISFEKYKLFIQPKLKHKVKYRQNEEEKRNHHKRKINWKHTKFQCLQHRNNKCSTRSWDNILNFHLFTIAGEWNKCWIVWAAAAAADQIKHLPSRELIWNVSQHKLLHNYFTRTWIVKENHVNTRKLAQTKASVCGFAVLLSIATAEQMPFLGE